MLFVEMNVIRCLDFNSIPEADQFRQKRGG